MVTTSTSIPSQSFANCGLSGPLGGVGEPFPNPCQMPDIASLLVLSAIGALPSSTARCGSCRRTPLAGEIVHRLDSGRELCELCFAKLPSDRRLAVSSERVHASERRLPVAPKAA
jgi:hypothetical protein